MFFRDLYLVAKHSRYLPRVLASSYPTNIEFRETFSEMNYLDETDVSLKQLLKEVVEGGGFDKPMGAEVFTVGPYDNGDDVWVFVNGITTSRDMAMRNALALSNVFRRAITVVHNPSHGVVADLVECAFARTFDKDCAVTSDLYAEVYMAMLRGKTIKLIGHSQGGIIVSRFLRRLQANQESYPELEVYTFASGADEDVPVKGVYQEHFANTDDFVSRIGMINVQPKSGTLYLRKEIGHLLNRDYLEHFAGGYFCGKQSRLFGYVGGNRG